ncbi:MAG: hypothetical protein AAF483_00875, partial [Planctomycetota bacterium]
SKENRYTALERYQLLMLYRNLLGLSEEALPVELQKKLIEALVNLDVRDDEFWLNRPCYYKDRNPDGLASHHVAGTQLRLQQVERAVACLEDTESSDFTRAIALMVLRSAFELDHELATQNRKRVIEALKLILLAARQEIPRSLTLLTAGFSFGPHIQPVLKNYQFEESKEGGEGTLNFLIVAMNLIANQQWQKELMTELENLHGRLGEEHIDQAIFPDVQETVWLQVCHARRNDSDQLVAFTLYLQTGELLGLDYRELREKPYLDEMKLLSKVNEGDVLAIHIPTILPLVGNPPVLQAGTNPPVVGIPVTVSSSGKIRLPYIEPIEVRGKDISQVLSSVKKAMIDAQILSGQKPLGISVEFLMRAHDPQEIRSVTGSPVLENPLTLEPPNREP